MAKRAQLVSQHLENISHEALSKYQDVIRSYVRGRQGIYALYPVSLGGSPISRQVSRGTDVPVRIPLFSFFNSRHW